MLALSKQRNVFGRLVRILALAAVVLFQIGAARAEAGGQTVSYCFNDWPPFAFLEDGKATGISVEVLTEATRRAGYTARFRQLPWKRCLESVEAGEMDAVMDALPRDQFIVGENSYTIYTNTLWVGKAETEARYRSGDIYRLRLGLVAGYEYGPALEQMMGEKGLQVDYSVDEIDNIRKLAFGRLDMIIGDFVSTRVLAQAHDLTIFAILPHHSYDRLFVSFNRERRTMLERVDAEIGRLIGNGFVDRAYQKHLGIGVTEVIPDS